MAYQLTRRAANASSYSDRTAKIGKPHASMNEALRAAFTLAKRPHWEPITVTDSATGEWACVSTVHYATGMHAGTRHVTLSLPAAWAARMPVLAGE